MQLAMILLFFQMQVTAQAETEAQKYKAIDEILNKLYNHSHLLSADQEAENMARALLGENPHNPLVYHLWASIEWLLIGRELNLKADEPTDITEINGYKERSERYRNMVNKGLVLTPQDSVDERALFFRAALMFDHAKFSARYEGQLSGLKRADKEAAEGVLLLRKALETEPKLCSAYLFLGGNRFQLANKTGSWTIQRLFIRNFSSVYNELYLIDSDVFNEKKAIEWLEKAYNCGYPEPWLKSFWLEASFLLAGAYHDYHKKLGVKEEFMVLPKETALLKQLVVIFPQNLDLIKKLLERELRLKVLGNYFSKK